MFVRILVIILLQSFLVMLLFVDPDALVSCHVIFSVISERSSDIVHSVTFFDFSKSNSQEIMQFFLSHKKIAIICALILLTGVLLLVELFIAFSNPFVFDQKIAKTSKNIALYVFLVGLSLLIFLLTPYAAEKSLERYISKAAYSMFPYIADLINEWPESIVRHHPKFDWLMPDEKRKRVNFEKGTAFKFDFPPTLPMVYKNFDGDMLGVYLFICSYEENWIVFSRKKIEDKRYVQIFTDKCSKGREIYCYRSTQNFEEL